MTDVDTIEFGWAAYRYVIVGGGMTGDSACRGIRDHDLEGPIGLFGSESHEPYARPPLSKALWSGKEESSVFRGTPELGVEVRTGRRIVALDLDARTATDDTGDGALVREARCSQRAARRGGCRRAGRRRRLLPDARRLSGLRASPATGVERRRDRRRLHRLRDRRGARVERVRGDDASSRTPAIGARLFPAELSAFVNEYYREKGVEVLAGELVERSGAASVTTRDGTTIEADVVVAGLGIVPATELAEAAASRSTTASSSTSSVAPAAVTTCSPPATWRGSRSRRSAERAASSTRITRTRTARGRREHGRRGRAVRPLPFFYSDLFDLGYEAVGEVDSRLDTVAEWAEPNRKGVVAYVDGERRPRGFLLWDVWGKVDAARELIRAGTGRRRGRLRPLLD